MTNDGGADAHKPDPVPRHETKDACVRCGQGKATELGVTQPNLVWFWCRRCDHVWMTRRPDEASTLS